MWAKDFVSNGNISNIEEAAHPLLINWKFIRIDN